MAVPIVMPSLGYMMEEGTVGAWLRQHGEWVERGTPIVEITTDKLNYQVEASTSGHLYSLTQEGAVLPVGAPIGYLLDKGEEPPSVVEKKPTSTEQPQAIQPKSIDSSDDKHVSASPVARRLARELDVNLANVTGSGPGGRIVEKDVRDAAQADGSGGAIRDVAVLDLPGTVKQVVPLKGLRGAIARRMHQSLSMSAQYTLTIGIDITEALRQRREFNQKRSESENRVRFLDIVIKAVTHSLQSHPGMNAVILGEEVLWINETHIGIAVAVDDGLIVPVLRDAGLMSLTEIARTAQDIEVRARAKQLTSSEVNGSTFTISLLGIVDAFTPIINPPEVAILGIGRATEKPAVVKGQVVPRSFATFSLTLDHRAIDGAVGASFLRRLLRLIEQPSQFFSI